MYSVVWPRGRSVENVGRMARRLNTLEGKRIGFLWDYIYRGDEIFRVIEREVAERYPETKFFSYEIFGNSHGGHEREFYEALPNKLKELEIDGVICGMAA